MTSIQPSDPPFEYKFKIPVINRLVLVPPHIHGFTVHALGGASADCRGSRNTNPGMGLPERIFVIRDQN